MTSRIIAAIVAVFAAVLSLAAPVAVDAQTPTLTVDRNLIGQYAIAYNGFTVGTTYYSHSCRHASASPASCTCSGATGIAATVTSGIWYFKHWIMTPDEIDEINNPHVRYAVYSDANCASEVAFVTFTQPTTGIPTWRARDITDDTATI